MSESGSRICFVIGPIGDPGSPERTHADWLLQGIIEPVFNGKEFEDYRVERADKIPTPGMIDAQMINRLLDAELVIADMSFRNPNAFYEMGIRHVKGLPIIHMYRVGETIPFDVKPHRAIPFSLKHPDDLAKARQELRVTVGEVIKPGFLVDNPVTRARGLEKISERATEPQQLLMDEVRDLQRRITVLEMGSRTTRLRELVRHLPQDVLTDAQRLGFLLQSDWSVEETALLAEDARRLAELTDLMKPEIPPAPRSPAPRPPREGSERKPPQKK